MNIFYDALEVVYSDRYDTRTDGELFPQIDVLLSLATPFLTKLKTRSLLSLSFPVISIVTISVFVFPADDNVCVAHLITCNSFDVTIDIA